MARLEGRVAGMRRAVLIAAVALTGASGALAGCDSKPKPTTPSVTAAPSGGSTAPAAQPYGGPALPGLAKSPLWTVSHHPKGIDLRFVAVGGSVVLARDDEHPPTVSPAPGAPLWTSPPTVLEFRDVATGAVKATVQTPLDSLRADEIGGQPVAVITYQGSTSGAGLNKPTTVRKLVAYDASGNHVGEYQAGTDRDDAFAFGAGRLVRKADGGAGTAVTVGTLGGAPGFQLSCALSACGYLLRAAGPPVLFVGGSGEIPAVLGDLAFGLTDTGQPTSRTLRLLAYDAASGQRRWSSESLQAPPGARGEDGKLAMRVRPVAMVGGKLLLSWAAQSDVDDSIPALHDPATGRLLASGPTLPDRVSTALTDASGTVAVVAATGSGSAIGAAALDLSANTVLWKPEPGERALYAVSVVNTVLYGHTVSEGTINTKVNDDYIAIDVRTKKVLADSLALLDAPVGTSSGHGLVLRDNTLYVFAPG